MYYIRRVLLAIILFNILFLILHGMATVLWSQITQTPIDDWQYKTILANNSPDFMEVASYAPLCLLGILIVFEISMMMLSLGMLKVAVFAVFALLFAASIAGPMVSSITDQSYSDYGFAVGGAKDVNNFRANIGQGFLPQPSDITYEGLFYDYHFATGKVSAATTAADKKLFAPTWSSAVSKNPETGVSEHFLAVGLKSQFDRSAFARKKLNLAVVLDISGSMECPFNQYYYGSRRGRPDMNDESADITKLQAACSSIMAMLEHLRPDDRLGIVLFNHRAHLAKPVSLVSQTDMAALKKHILDIQSTGATNMEEGLEMGKSMLAPFSFADPEQFENRIIFLTDAMPNTDDTSESGLLDLTREMARNRTYLTFIGMGVDFNSQLVKSITQVRGANYYSVHSPAEFKQRLADEFECMVTPMVFDLSLTISSPDCRIVKVIGSPEADLATGRIMQVKTLFPSPTNAEGSRGGIILLQLDKPLHDCKIAMTVSYENRAGFIDESNESFVFKANEPEYFDDNGIRKGILLARYADILMNVATRKHKRAGPATQSADGSGWSYWERPARPLEISAAAQTDLADFSRYFGQEMTIIGDPELIKEQVVLIHLSKMFPGNVIKN